MPRRRGAPAWTPALFVVALVLGEACSGSPSTPSPSAVSLPPPTTAAVSNPPSALPRGILAAIAVGTGPLNLAVGGGGVWVENRGGGNISRIDPGTNTAGGVIDVSTHCSVAYGDGVLWSTNSVTGILSRIDPSTKAQTATLDVPGACGLALNGEVVFVVSIGSGQLWEVDPKVPEVVARIDLGVNPDGNIVLGAGSAWIAGEADGGTVWKVDPETRKVASTLSVEGVDTIVFAAGAIWASGRLAPSLYRIDPSSGEIATFTITGAPSGIAEGLGSLWVTDYDAGTLRRLNAVTGKVGPPFALGSSHVGPPLVAFGSVWVASADGNVVLRVDPNAVAAP